MRYVTWINACPRLIPLFNFKIELKEYIKVKDEIYEVKNDIIGRNEEVPLKRSRKVKHKVTIFYILHAHLAFKKGVHHMYIIVANVKCYILQSLLWWPVV